MAQRNQIADRYRKHMQRVHTAAGATSVAAAAASTSAASASVPAAGDGAESEIAETLTPKLTSTAHPTKSRREPLALEDWQHRRSQHRQGKHRYRWQTQDHLDDIKDQQQEQQTLPVVGGFALALPPQETRAVAEDRIALQLALAESALEDKGASAEHLEQGQGNTIGKLLDRSKDMQGDYVIDWNWCLDKDNVSCSATGLLFTTPQAAKSLNSKFKDHLKIEKLQRANKEQSAPGDGVFFQSSTKTLIMSNLPLYLHYFRDAVQVSHVSPVHMAPKHCHCELKRPADCESLPHKVLQIKEDMKKKMRGGRWVHYSPDRQSGVITTNGTRYQYRKDGSLILVDWKLRPLQVEWSSPWLLGERGRRGGYFAVTTTSG